MLSSLKNPLVKQLRKLHQSRERHKRNVFLLEGTHLIEEACSAAWPLEVVCHTLAWQQQHPELWERVSACASRLELVHEDVMRAIATTVEPDGVMAIAPRRLSSADASLSSPRSTTSPILGIALETLQDPGNLGTIIRTAAAAGVDFLWTSADSVDLDHPKVLRASAGQWFRLKMGSSPTLEDEIVALKKQGVQIVATLPDAPLSYWKADFNRPTLILAGNEGAGLSASSTQLADVQVQIPLEAGVESLNVAIAVALIVYEAKRQRNDTRI